MSGADYAARVTEFAKLMESVEPSVTIGTVTAWDQPKWNDPVIKGAADAKGLVDFLIVHYYAGGAVATQGFAMWDNSVRSVTFDVGEAGTHDILLEAAGQPCGGVFTLMALELDGTDLGTVTVDAHKHQGKRKAFAFAKELAAGPHPDAQNAEGAPALIVLHEKSVAGGKQTAPLELSMRLPPCSVTTILIRAAPDHHP